MGGYADIDFCIFYFCVQKSLLFDEKILEQSGDMSR